MRRKRYVIGVLYLDLAYELKSDTSSSFSTASKHG